MAAFNIYSNIKNSFSSPSIHSKNIQKKSYHVDGAIAPKIDEHKKYHHYFDHESKCWMSKNRDNSTYNKNSTYFIDVWNVVFKNCK